jgi:glycosyltransferase involved in cell wall biosynthesis
MKLLIYSHAFAPGIGGVETIVMTLARGLAERPADERNTRFEVTVATQTPRDDYDDNALPFRVSRQPGLWKLLKLIYSADVVHLAGPVLLPLGLCLLLRKPVVTEHHGYQAICPNGLLLYQATRCACPGHFEARRYTECWVCNRIEHSLGRSVWMILSTFLRRYGSKKATTNLAISGHVLERLRLPRSEVVYYGIPDNIERLYSPDCMPGREFPLTFAFVGRLVAEKGLALLVDAASRLKNEGFVFRLKFVGEGPERSKLESLIREAGLQSAAEVTGFQTGDELAKTLGGIDVVVMPSVMEETAGLAAIEQMMRGRLVIASAIGGLAEIVGDAGLTYRPGDAGALAECLRRVLHNPRIVEELGAKARARALQLFASQRMIEEHVRCYRRICLA